MTNLIVYCYILPWIECWLAPLQEFQIKITLTLHSSAKIPHIPENLDNKMFTSIVLLKFEIIWDIFFFQVSWLKSGAVEVVSVGELVFSSDSRVTVSSLTRSCKVTLHSRNVVQIRQVLGPLGLLESDMLGLDSRLYKSNSPLLKLVCYFWSSLSWIWHWNREPRKTS